ncbi:hypothetical protein [Agrobacterium tumefaciens]|uniref:hypothetical protein n=1 Tax=Agrobacterium tumefaciens TaxID=358 RepID=UPI001110041C|nr:hypothetical protein [Agrobacterium tumefaciens]
MSERDNTRFIEDCAFAKIVTTADGSAINIGGEIINVRSAEPSFHVDAIVSALRSVRGRFVGGEVSSCLQQPAPVDPLSEAAASRHRQ